MIFGPDILDFDAIDTKIRISQIYYSNLKLNVTEMFTSYIIMRVFIF